MFVNGIRVKFIPINSHLLLKYLFLLTAGWLIPPDQYAQKNIQLASPQTESTSVYFKNSACVWFEFRQQGATIRYTLNGDEPDENSSVYKEPICVSGSGTIKAKSFAPEFLSSSSIKVQCIKTSGSIELVEGSLPENPYDKSGLKILYDGRPGNINSKNGWLGFRKDTLEWKIQFSKKQKVKKVHISMLQSQGSWIFYPERIELISFKGEQLGQRVFNSEQSPEEKNIFSFPVKKKISGLIVRIHNYTSLPEWHPGKGNKPWFFIDEIAVE
jgi:hypothetical protein